MQVRPELGRMGPEKAMRLMGGMCPFQLLLPLEAHTDRYAEMVKLAVGDEMWEASLIVHSCWHTLSHPPCMIMSFESLL